MSHITPTVIEEVIPQVVGDINRYMKTAIDVKMGDDEISYYDVIPGDRFLITDYGTFEVDPGRAGSGLNFGWRRVKLNMLFLFAYKDDNNVSGPNLPAKEKADRGATTEMVLIPHLINGFCASDDAEGYGIFYEFMWGGMCERSLRQPLDHPDVYIADVSTSAYAKFGIKLNPNGTYIYP
jgi:hypothetical protein